VPVLRSSDGTVLPTIGKPFSPGNMPKYNTDPLGPSLEIKAYAGPMSSEQAQTFQKRWKTPPRLIPSAPNPHNLSFSPKSCSISSPLKSPRMSKSMCEMISSTPKLKKKLLFTDGSGDIDDFESVYISNVSENDRNGNIKFDVLNEQEEKEFKELYEDLLEDKIRMKDEKNKKFQAYRNPQPLIVDTPLKNDSNSNHIRQNFNNSSNLRLNSNDSLFCNPGSTFNSGLITTFLDESGSVFDSVTESLSFKEKNIRLTDPSKGLETIGRGLAAEFHVGWKEYWDFLGQFVDIRTSEGLNIFEEFLKQKEKKNELNEMEEKSPKANDSFGLSDICAGFDNINLSEKGIANRKNGLTSPTSRNNPLMELLSNLRQSSNDFPLVNPYMCIEQSCRTFAKRLASLLEGDSIQDQHSYEKTLLVEINKLNTSIDSYKRDTRFNSVNFQKVHARYSFLLVWYLKVNNINVKYLRNSVPLMSKVYALATQFTQQDTKDLIKSHAVCISTFTSNYIERQEKIFNPENVNTETACFDAWNGPDIIECKCALEINFTSSKQRINHRRDIRKKLYSG
jgi:ankyrin repeat and LEM domain-containing protein 2